MKTLQEIKDEVAKEKGYDDWNDLIIQLRHSLNWSRINDYFDEATLLFTEQAIDKCAEVAEAEDMSDSPPIVNKESILKVKTLLT